MDEAAVLALIWSEGDDEEVRAIRVAPVTEDPIRVRRVRDLARTHQLTTAQLRGVVRLLQGEGLLDEGPAEWLITWFGTDRST